MRGREYWHHYDSVAHYHNSADIQYSTALSVILL